MILYILLITLSVITNTLITYFSNLYDKWYFILIMVILLPITLYLYVLLYIGIMSFISLFIRKNKERKPNKLSNFMIKETSYLIFKLINCKIHINGNLDLPKEKVLIVSNHRSNFDPLIITAYIKKFPILSVTKPSNLEAPIFGKYTSSAGYILMDREDDLKAAKAIGHAAKLIKDDIANILIFPEGKRNHDEHTLDFHAGSFKIAFRSKAPIILICLSNQDKITINPFKRNHVYLDIIKIYNSDDYKDNNTTSLSIDAKNLIDLKYEERIKK